MRRGKAIEPDRGCVHRLSVVEVERILAERSLVPPLSAVVSPRRCRTYAIAAGMGLRVELDEFGRESLSRADAAAVVAEVVRKRGADRAQFEADVRAAQQRTAAEQDAPRRRGEERAAAAPVSTPAVKLPPGVRLTAAGASMLGR